MAKKDVNELSAAELYELAKQREVEEQEKERAALAKDIDKVKAEKKKLTADYRKQMRALAGEHLGEPVIERINPSRFMPSLDLFHWKKDR